jgi:hypothetical protein
MSKLQNYEKNSSYFPYFLSYLALLRVEVTWSEQRMQVPRFECMHLQLTPFDRTGAKKQEAEDQIKQICSALMIICPLQLG